MNRLERLRAAMAQEEARQKRERFIEDGALMDLGDVRDLLAVAEAVAELPWTKTGLLIDIPEIAGLSGSCKDRRLRHLQTVLAPLLKEVAP